MILTWIIVLILYGVGGASKAVMDTLQFKFDKSVFSDLGRWWDPKDSWLKKYKSDDPTAGRAFPGSMTWLVWTTDAWHFFQMIQLSSYDVTVSLLAVGYFDLQWWAVFGVFAVLKLIRGFVFELCWNMLFRK